MPEVNPVTLLRGTMNKEPKTLSKHESLSKVSCVPTLTPSYLVTGLLCSQ